MNGDPEGSRTTRAGFVSVVGRPNVGKSTLVNALVGQKVAITSPRPQTTRNTIRGVLTSDDRSLQIVLVDTPGLHRPRTALGERLNRLVYGTLAETDAVLFVLDATQPVGPGDRLIAQRLDASSAPVVVIVNKADAASPADIAAQLADAGQWGFSAYVPTSALGKDGLALVVAELEPLIPHGPLYFPPDMISDQPERLLAAELVREKYLARLIEELPHSLAVVVDDIDTRPDGLVHVAAIVYVERDSQKGIVIGKRGDVLKSVGAEARRDLENLFGARVYLELRVKVEKDWQRRQGSLDRLGF